MNTLRAHTVSWLTALTAILSGVCFAASVTTHHVDNFRTGWNSQETALTTANVNATYFSQQAVVQLDAQVDAQPLVLSNQTINGTVYSTVVYVATENNSVYAIDGAAGTVLAQVNLGTPVTVAGFSSCNNNSSIVGINSTPVIDPTAGILYVVSAIQGSGTIAYHLHALSTSTLADTTSALAIAAPPGAAYNRQRSALTLFNGGVLIPFTSFCDNSPTTLGYLVFAYVSGSSSSQTSFQTSLYSLSSIWMSGSGPAISGNSIYFSTGNQLSANSISGPPSTNLPDSLIRLTGSTGMPPTLTLSAVVTPDTSILGATNDQDFGAGGVLIIPSGAPSSITASTGAQFVTGLGKTGVLYVNNPGLGPSYVQAVGVSGDCHCGTSYFTGADGSGHVVTSAGNTLGLYTVSASGLTLTNSTSLPSKAHGDPGVFTSISSNGTVAGTGVIWMVSGPDSTLGLNLYAYDATNLSQLFSYNTGYWPTIGGNSNTVPTVANGHVYVASYNTLTIWGAAPGALPAIPANLSPVADCPFMDVSWSAVPGATSYKLYSQPGTIWNPSIRALRYNGTGTSAAALKTTRGSSVWEVLACNQNGCSNPSAPVTGFVQTGQCP